MKLNEGDKLDWDLKAQVIKIILIVTKVEKKVRNEPKPRGWDKETFRKGSGCSWSGCQWEISRQIMGRVRDCWFNFINTTKIV